MIHRDVLMRQIEQFAKAIATLVQQAPREQPDEVLRSIDEAYRRNHRGGDIGFYRFESTGERSGEVTCENPYPCEFDRGLIRAVARRYAPVESFVFVEERGDRCRRRGDDACTYTVSW